MKKQLLLNLLLMGCLVNAKAQNADVRLLQYINGPASGADPAWRGVANSVGFTSTLTPTTMLIVGLASHDKELTVKAFETAGSVIIAAGLAVGLKSITQRPRPYNTYPDLIIPKTDESSYAFPSGHTSMAFATATSLSLSFPKWYVIAPAFTYASAVGYSRLYLGVHYPSDVLGGAVLGAGSALLTWELQKLLNKKFHYH